MSGFHTIRTHERGRAREFLGPAICPENRLDWPADPDLPGTYSQWLTDIIQFVKGPVDLSDPVYSPLGENKLFLTGTGPEDNDNPNWEQPSNPDWNLPNQNPNVDIVDVHHGMYSGDGELANSFNASQVIRAAYTSSGSGTKRPFHQGEFNYYSSIPVPFQQDDYGMQKIYDNYDVSFHNEIWASAFFGNFASGTTWEKERVFWWERHLPVPPPESFAQNPHDPYHTNVLGAVNILNPDDDSVHVRNRTLYHNFKPLSSFLANPNFQAYNFFNGAFDAHKVYNDTSKIEAYYLTDSTQTMAIGWVHNLNAYWENHYYVTNTDTTQDFFGCTAPSSQQAPISGLRSGMDYHITWFPTRMNDTIHPVDAVDTSGTGIVLLDMGSAPLGDTLNKYLDTLHVDYAFIIALQPVHRNMQVSAHTFLEVSQSAWDFYLFPNPASNQLNLAVPDDAAAEVTIYDLSGRRLQAWSHIHGPRVQLPTTELAQGAYYVRVASGEHSRTKPLIIR